MDNGSNKDIAAMVSANNKFFYKHVVKGSSDKDSDDGSDMLLVLGFDANNNKIISYATLNCPKNYLLVMLQRWCSVTYP
jgi:hypothetical protein